MKRLLLLLFLLASSAYACFAQIETNQQYKGKYITGSIQLRRLARDLSSKFSKESKSEAAQRRGINFADSGEPAIGDQVSFFLDKKSNGNTKSYPALLKVIGKYCYVYLEKGRQINDATLKKVAKIFDEKIYPTTSGAFGSEWKPGIDGDPRITLFLVGGMEGCDGFFYPGDEYTADKYPTSNEREMLYLSINRLKDIEDFMGHLVAHEMQHMIHWNNDPNETFWVEEGLSEYAATLCGQFPWTAEQFFQFPDRNLIDWEDTKEAENYGHVFLFTDFMLNRPGISETKRQKLILDVVKNKKSGVNGIIDSLQRVAPKISFDDVFRDFCAGIFLYKSFAGQHNYSFSPYTTKKLAKYATNQVQPKKTFKSLNGIGKGKVSVWSAASYNFACTDRPDHLNVSFTGSTLKTPFGKNRFMLGLALVDSTRKTPPRVIWLRTTANKASHKVKLPSGKYDQLQFLVLNRGPNLHKAEDGRLAKVGFEFSVSSDNSSTNRFEDLHNPSPRR